jgi:hypothetical protein
VVNALAMLTADQSALHQEALALGMLVIFLLGLAVGFLASRS